MPNVHVRLHDWNIKDILDGVRDGRLQLGLIVPPPKASALHDLRYEELFRARVCVVVAPHHPFARRRAIPIAEVAAEPLIGLTREDYPGYYDHLSIIFSKVKQKPRVVEEHDSYYGIISAVEAGIGVAIGVDVLRHSFGNRVKLLPSLLSRSHFRSASSREKENLVQPRKNSGSAPKKLRQKNSRLSALAAG